MGQFNSSFQEAWLWLDISIDVVFLLDSAVLLLSAYGRDAREAAHVPEDRRNAAPALQREASLLSAPSRTAVGSARKYRTCQCQKLVASLQMQQIGLKSCLGCTAAGLLHAKAWPVLQVVLLH